MSCHQLGEDSVCVCVCQCACVGQTIKVWLSEGEEKQCGWAHNPWTIASNSVQRTLGVVVLTEACVCVFVFNMQ